MPRKVREDVQKANMIANEVRNSAGSRIQKRPSQRGGSAFRRHRPSVKAGNNSENFAALQQIWPDSNDAFAGSDTPISPEGPAPTRHGSGTAYLSPSNQSTGTLYHCDQQ